jgi:YrbI family 3-deoxy-D-manno-octulosonate 8-phosphate phosphatase
MVFDCDGVLTDGRIIYDSAGNESKNFDAHDGMGFNILKHTDIKTAVITGRNHLFRASLPGPEDRLSFPGSLEKAG